jgi:glycolate oxidase FAD binding subunit
VVERHARDLAQLARDTGAASFEVLEDADKQRLLGRVREFLRIVAEQLPGAAVLRSSVLAASAVETRDAVAAIARQHNLECATLLRAANTVYSVLDVAGTAPSARLAAALQSVMSPASGGKGMVVEQCPAALKNEINVWGPVREDFALMRRLKQVFDPHGILSPGRFVGGL